MMQPVVTVVSRSMEHGPDKPNRDRIRLLAGLGVEGDAHLGQTVQHLSRVARDPSQPNLRQVHLIHAELHDELRAAGFDVAPGQMGENVTTRGRSPRPPPRRRGGGIVLAGGEVRPGEAIRVALPPPPHRPLEPV